MSGVSTFGTLATLTASLLQKYIKYDAMLYGPVRDLFKDGLEWIYNAEYDVSGSIIGIWYDDMIFYVKYIFLCMSIATISYCIWKYYIKNNMRNCNRIDVYDENKMHIISTIFDLYHSCFDVTYHSYGNGIETNGTEKMKSSKQIPINVKVSFNLPIIGKGHLILTKYTIDKISSNTQSRSQSSSTTSDEQKININTLSYILYINNEYGIHNIWNDFNELIEQHGKQSERTGLHMYKVFKSENTTGTLYYCKMFLNKPSNEFEEMQTCIWDGYFSNHEMILKYMSNENLEKHQCNILLHGPPGTGKSKFIYNLAVHFKRNVVMVDLRYVDRFKLYHILYSPHEVCGRGTNNDNFIIVFEEFDISLDYILDRHNDLQSKLEEDKKSKKKYDTDLMKQYKYSPECRMIVSPRDLLEALQGPIPIRGNIIIATTNNYEKYITDPKYEPYRGLFRDGRMNCIYVGYINHDNFKKLCNYYFNQDPDFELYDGHTITTSTLTTIAETSDSYYDFKKRVCTILEN